MVCAKIASPGKCQTDSRQTACHAILASTIPTTVRICACLASAKGCTSRASLGHHAFHATTGPCQLSHCGIQHHPLKAAPPVSLDGPVCSASVRHARVVAAAHWITQAATSAPPVRFQLKGSSAHPAGREHARIRNRLPAISALMGGTVQTASSASTVGHFPCRGRTGPGAYVLLVPKMSGKFL